VVLCRKLGAVVSFIAIVTTLSACGGGTTTTTTSTGGEVSVIVTSPTSGSVIAGNSVTVRGTVSPPTATVQVQGKPAAVGDGVFTAAGELHGGKTTIDVIGSAPGQVPGSTSVVVVQQSSGGSGGSPHTASSPSSTNGSATPGIAGERAPSTGGGSQSAGGQSSCGGDLSVGPDTTCEFAEDVQSAYRSSGGSSTVEAFSPVTNKTYEMTCVTGAQVKCTGGIGATVYFSP